MGLEAAVQHMQLRDACISYGLRSGKPSEVMAVHEIEGIRSLYDGTVMAWCESNDSIGKDPGFVIERGLLSSGPLGGTHVGGLSDFVAVVSINPGELTLCMRN